MSSLRSIVSSPSSQLSESTHAVTVAEVPRTVRTCFICAQPCLEGVQTRHGRACNECVRGCVEWTWGQREQAWEHFARARKTIGVATA